MGGVQFGDTNDKKFGLVDQSVIIETAKQCTYIPTEYYQMIFNEIMEYSSGYFITADGDAIVDCGDRALMDDLSLHINGVWF